MNPGTIEEPEKLARHPFGRVPSLEHDGFTLYEIQAIARYVEAKIAASIPQATLCAGVIEGLMGEGLTSPARR